MIKKIKKWFQSKNLTLADVMQIIWVIVFAIWLVEFGLWAQEVSAALNLH